MLNWGNKKNTQKESRSLEDLRDQLKTIESQELLDIRGGQGLKPIAPVLKSCGGWMPQ